MTVIFGDKTDFAIEAGIEPDGHTESTVWGHMCVWCGEVPLGDLNERYCCLFHAYSELTWFADNLDGLWAPELDGLDDVGAWNFLDGLLFGHHGDVPVADDRTIEECARDWRKWGCFSFLTNWGEQFDSYKSFLLCPSGEHARVLSRSVSSPSVSAFRITRTGFKLAIASFAKWFESESLRLGINCDRLTRQLPFTNHVS